MCASGRDICGAFGGVADLCRDSLHLRWSLPPFVSRDLSHRSPPLCSLLPSNHHALPSLTSSTRLYPRSLTCRQSDWYWPSCVYLLTISLRNAIIPDRRNWHRYPHNHQAFAFDNRIPFPFGMDLYPCSYPHIHRTDHGEVGY